MYEQNDLHYPYTYGEKSSFDIFAWFKLISITVFAFFFLSFFYTDLLQLLLHGSFLEAAKTHWAEFTVFGAILFLLINIAGLEWAAKENWKLLFKKLTWKDGKIIVISTILAWIFSILGQELSFFDVGSKANPAVTHVASTFWIHEFESIFQLMGEEFLGIIPFLALVSLGKYLKLDSRLVIFLAVLLSSFLFGVFSHLDLRQCISRYQRCNFASYRFYLFLYQNKKYVGQLSCPFYL
jgi:hypothetical protein